ncbi:MAG: sensor domain-containing protein [Chloroflexota bacterium]|nr:MAG: sensor domain-containing protein [Chloroflexota bacterium]
MHNAFHTLGRFLKVVSSGQSYLNLIYLLASFPLGIFYFVFLVSGLSTGLSLAIIWIGIPILFLVGVIWWQLARFERSLAITILKEDVPTMIDPTKDDAIIWIRLREYFVNPVTWKSLLYLFLKFPLGMATFVIVVTFVSLTLSFLTMPLTFRLLGNFQIGLFTHPNQSLWIIDSLNDALLAVLIGLFLWPVTLHVINGIAWAHAKLARLMLSINPLENLTSVSEA